MPASDSDMKNMRIVGIFRDQKYIDYFESQGIACIGIAPDLHNIQIDCRYIFQNPEDITEKDIELAYCRFHGLPMEVMSFSYNGGEYLLRELCMSDIDALFELYEQPGMTDFMEPLFERQAEIEYQQNYIDRIYGFYGYGQWLLFKKEGDVYEKLIGRFGVESRESCADETQVELGYALHPDYCGRGLATYVCDRVCDYAFNVLDMKSVIARVDDENVLSVKLVKRLGFEKYTDGVYLLKSPKKVDNSEQ